MLSQLDHIGIAVKNLPQALEVFEKGLGLKCERIEDVPSQQVRVAFLKIGEARLELIQPIQGQGPVAKFIETRGEGIHHLAFATDDLESQIAQARNAGCRMIHETPTTGAHGKEIAFAHPSSTQGVLVEFCSSGTPAESAPGSRCA